MSLAKAKEEACHPPHHASLAGILNDDDITKAVTETDYWVSHLQQTAEYGCFHYLLGNAIKPCSIPLAI